MAWSSFHRGDYGRMRRNLTAALLEAEALEPRAQVAYAEGLVPAEIAAQVGLVRLLLERADTLIRDALDVQIADNFNVYADKALAAPNGLESDWERG